MRNADDFCALLKKAMKHPEPDYGGNVLPAARIYSGLKSMGELQEFQSAVETLLSSDDPKVRSSMANVCVGFIVFRDAIEWPKLARNVG
jgi:hypothetical protein